MFLGREDVVRQGEGSDRSLTLPGMSPHQSAPLSEAVMEKIPMSRTPHMEQYDGVSHPQNQSLLPYLISSRSREDTIMRNRAALRSSTPSNDGRPHAPSWRSSTPGASTSSGGSHAMYKAPFGAPPRCLSCLPPRSTHFDPRPSMIPTGLCVWLRTKWAIHATFAGINESDMCPAFVLCSIPTSPDGTCIVPWNTPIALR